MLWFVDVDALNDAVSSPNLACGLRTIMYNQQTSSNTPVLLQKAVLSHLILCFVDVDLDALNDDVSSPNLACGLYMTLYNQQTSQNAPVLLEKAVICHLMF